MLRETHRVLLARGLDVNEGNTQDLSSNQAHECARSGGLVRGVSAFPSGERRAVVGGRMNVSMDQLSGAMLVDTGAVAQRERIDRTVRRSIEPELFSYRLLSPRNCGIADVPLLGEAYRCWSSVWTETFRELDGVTHVPSDDFTRQDEVGAIFYGYECVALSCFRWIDMANPMYRDDSYFRIWPESARIEACRQGTRLCIGSYITVSSDWRQTPVRNILSALTVDRSLLSDADALVGTMRDDRGMARVAAGMGADTLGHAQLHGVPVTLIAVYHTSQRPPLDAETEVLVRRLRESIPIGGMQ